jgi:hypothetical protein
MRDVFVLIAVFNCIEPAKDPFRTSSCSREGLDLLGAEGTDDADKCIFIMVCNHLVIDSLQE